MSQKTSKDRKAPALLGALLVVLLASGTLAGCGGSEGRGDAPDEVPASPEEAGEVVMRVSGTKGTAFSGTYGSLAEGESRIVDDTLGDEPTEYEVETQEGVSDGVSAFFEKTEPSSGKLEVEIVADGEVIAESTTYAQFGSVIVDWFPQNGLLEQPLPGEGQPEESP